MLFSADPGSVTSSSIAATPFVFAADGPWTLQFTHAFAFEPNSDGGVVEANVNCTGWSDIGGSATAALELGAHTFTIQAVDVAGNLNATPVVRTFYVVPPSPVVAVDDQLPAAAQTFITSKPVLRLLTVITKVAAPRLDTSLVLRLVTITVPAMPFI